MDGKTPDDTDQARGSVASAKDISSGDTIADLGRIGLGPNAQFDQTKPFPRFVFNTPVPPITLEQTPTTEDGS